MNLAIFGLYSMPAIDGVDWARNNVVLVVAMLLTTVGVVLLQDGRHTPGG